ncbi:MAG TPA: L,D-transpeptidase family protein [Chitinophagaceae bacterium]|nr:L,D-transpeptidase family protein [Chitinophagaceae bacterium]
MQKFPVATAVLLLWLPVALLGQGSKVITPTYFETVLSHCNDVSSKTTLRFYYAAAGYQLHWAGNDRVILQLVNYLNKCDELGLDKSAYHYNFINEYAMMDGNEHGTDEMFRADIYFADAAIHFFHDISFGTHAPPLQYQGFEYQPDTEQLVTALLKALLEKRFQYFLFDAEHCSPEYVAMKQQLQLYNRMVSAGNDYSQPLLPGKINRVNNLLLAKLQQLGIISLPKGDTIEPTALLAAVHKAQALFDLPAEDRLTAAFTTQLNLPLKYRIAALKEGINTLRWLDAIRQQSRYIAVVNIPSATLTLFAGNEKVLASRLIVGKRSTPTPTLSSIIKEVIVFPYWFVPRRLAVQELLPAIKRNPNYLAENNFQVLNEQGILVNTQRIHWASLNAGNFPYQLRQSTGCDNSLGVLKIAFYNPFNVYLHDTPTKPLFTHYRRYFSHGCMRVEKAVDLARLLLKDRQAIMDSIIQRGCVKDQQPVVLPAEVTMPLFVVYNTAWTDAGLQVKFYYNVYNKGLPSER